MLMNGWKELNSRDPLSLSPLSSPTELCTRAVANKPPQVVKASNKVAASLQESLTWSAIVSRGLRETYSGPCSKVCRGVDSSEDVEVMGSSSQQMNSCIIYNQRYSASEMSIQYIRLGKDRTTHVIQ